MTWSQKSLILLLAVTLPAMPSIAASKKGAKTKTPPPAPTDNSATITADQKDITDARAALADAQKALDDGASKLTNTFEASDEVVVAKKAVADDAALAQTARDAVMTKLAADATYQAAVAKEKKARGELNDLRGDQADQDAISAKAKEVFDDGGVTSKLERDAQDADPTYSAAAKKLAADNKTLSDMRAKFKDGLKTDTTLATLRQTRDDAQTKLIAAQAKLSTDRGQPAPTTPTPKPATPASSPSGDN